MKIADHHAERGETAGTHWAHMLHLGIWLKGSIGGENYQRIIGTRQRYKQTLIIVSLGKISLKDGSCRLIINQTLFIFEAVTSFS